MIDFELPKGAAIAKQMVGGVAKGLMRKWARWADDHEHEKVEEYVNFMYQVSRTMDPGAFGGGSKKKENKEGEPAGGEKKKKGGMNLQMAVVIEELSFGDAGLYLQTPNPGLGGAAVSAVGTDLQKEKFLKRFADGKPKWGAMAITEPGAGSDTAAITTTAVLDEKTKEWILNGEKIFVTQGKSAVEDSEGFVVVWATLDRKAGRAGIKSFVVDHHTPGMKVTKIEEKLGIRASDTAVIVFEDCRIPYENLLGDPEVKTGFKGAMATFDNTRPMVAASALGIGRAAVELVKEEFAKAGIPIRYGVAQNKLTARERDVMWMEAQLQAARLLTWKATSMADQSIPNSLESSMCKAKAGLAMTMITTKAVELLGPLGYSKNMLLEKWIRDAKINDIFEGTGQINMLVVARRILGYSAKELK